MSLPQSTGSILPESSNDHTMTAAFSFRVVAQSGAGRAGLLSTPHGDVPTPVFMPVGTQATVKSLTPDDVRAAGASIVLANTYHLYLRPGAELVAALGGLHSFSGWSGPILTDSGGFQVFSLAGLRRVTPDGVVFQSHLDGTEHVFTPALVMQLQESLGADIVMAFDECPPWDAGREYHLAALDRTHRWAERCRNAQRRTDQALFAIVQGGTFADLRRDSARFLAALDFPGYALGGLSVGEPKSATWASVEQAISNLPGGKPRYLMGVGTPEDLVAAVARGVDMLDSVLPTRIARNGTLFVRNGRLNIRNAANRALDAPIDADCDCYTCRTYSAAYLHHLFRSQELLAYRLASIHNVRFMVRLAGELRAAIIRQDH